jgi:phospholipid/cholesterol/gamma-HCH transport system permease protein
VIINPFTFVRTKRRAENVVAVLGRLTLEFLAAAGQSSRLGWQALRCLWHDPPQRAIISTQLYHIGFLSLPVVLLTGMSMGLVLAAQSYNTLHGFDAEAMTGPMVNFGMVSQVGPSMTALLVAGRAGSNIAAELGTMKVTEQLDALRVMGTSPISYLVLPRLIACTALLPVLGALAGLVGMGASAFLTITIWHVDGGAYWHQTAVYVQRWDILMGLAKCPFFGLIIGLVACRQGMMTGGGATGVGESCTRAVVQSSLLVLVLNFFLTLISNELYALCFLP